MPAATVEIVEAFLESKEGNPDGGADRLVRGPRFFGVIDGATPRGPSWRGRPPGEVVADVVATVLEAPDAPALPQELVETINRGIQAAAQSADVDLGHVAARADAGFAAFHPETRAVYHIHDCAFGFVLDDGSFETHRHEKAVDRLTSELRARAIELLRGAGVDPFAGDRDLGREFIRPWLERLPELQNITSSDTTPWALGLPRSLLAYRTLNGFPTQVELAPVPPETREIVLASDGFPELHPSLAAARERLAELLAADPHCVRELRGAKGLRPTNRYHDDLSYLRLKVS